MPYIYDEKQRLKDIQKHINKDIQLYEIIESIKKCLLKNNQNDNIEINCNYFENTCIFIIDLKFFIKEYVESIPKKEFHKCDVFLRFDFNKKTNCFENVYTNTMTISRGMNFDYHNKQVISIEDFQKEVSLLLDNFFANNKKDLK